MLENNYRYAVLLNKEDGASLGCVALEVDWEPAAEWAWLCSVRKGGVPLVNGARAASIQPLWDRKAGEPYCRGFRVSVARNGSGKATADFGTSYFRDVASRVSARFVQQGKLEAGEHFQYAVVALPNNETTEPYARAGFRADEKEVVLGLTESCLSDWVSRARPIGIVDADDLPVFIPQQVLDEAAAQTRAEEGRETGGVLIGKLCHDPAVPDIFATVTAQIPAEHTRGDAVKLTFTPETWAAVEAAIKLRGGSEIYLGYWHSHPVREWCKAKECTPEKQKNCALAKDFFSADDQALLRAVFPRAYSLGLVVNDTAFADLTFSLFGWREGSVQPRGFYLQEENHAT